MYCTLSFIAMIDLTFSVPDVCCAFAPLWVNVKVHLPKRCNTALHLTTNSLLVSHYSSSTYMYSSVLHTRPTAVQSSKKRRNQDRSGIKQSFLQTSGIPCVPWSPAMAVQRRKSSHHHHPGSYPTTLVSSLPYPSWFFLLGV